MAWVKQLDHKLKFVMMPDCPRILSMGKLVKEQRLAFHWVPDQRPYLQNCNTGEIAWLEVECDTPVMPNHLQFIPPGWDPLVRNMMCPLRAPSSVRRPTRKSRRTVLMSEDSSDKSESTGITESPVTSKSSRGLGRLVRWHLRGLRADEANRPRVMGEDGKVRRRFLKSWKLKTSGCWTKPPR